MCKNLIQLSHDYIKPYNGCFRTFNRFGRTDIFNR